MIATLTALKPGQRKPITPSAIIVCDCLSPYALGDLIRKSVVYHTAKFLKLEEDTQNSRIKTNVYACPDDAAWEAVQQLWRQSQGSMSLFAERLRSLKSYQDQLEEAGGISAAPNPLSGLVIAATEPDHPFPPSGVKWPALRCELHNCARHTLAMVEIDGFSYSNTGYRLTSQIDHFPVANQTAADEILELAKGAQEAVQALRRYLEEELGTYQAAEEDGRHARRVVGFWPETTIEDQVLNFDGSPEEGAVTFDDALLDADLLSPQGGLTPSPAPGGSSGVEGNEALIDLPSDAAALMRIQLKIDELESPAPQKKPVVLSVADIRLDGGTQQRYCLSPGALDEYTDHLKAGGDLPPVQVLHDGEAYWMVDGFHRIEAHVRAGLDAIFAFVETGTQREAILKSVAANQNHGVRRTNFDKRNAVMTLIKDEEWSAWSDREIARRAGVSHTYVANLRIELKEAQAREEKWAKARADQTVTETPSESGIISTSTLAKALNLPEEPPFKPGDYVSVFDNNTFEERSGLARVVASGQRNALIEWPDKSTENVPVEDLTFKGHQHEIPQRDLVGAPQAEISDTPNVIDIEEATEKPEETHSFKPGDRVKVLPPHVSAGSIGLVAANYAGISDRWIPVVLEGWRGDTPCLFTAPQLELVEAGYAKSGVVDTEEEAELSSFEFLKLELSVLQALYQVEQSWRIQAENDLEAALQEISLLSAQVENLKAENCG